MFSKKIKLVLTNEEWRITVNALNELRNKLIAEGRYTDAVDELLVKIYR